MAQTTVPFLAFWGKAQPQHGAAHTWHPVAYHLLDVAAAVDAMLSARPLALARGARLLGIPSVDARRLLVAAAALHDVGKFARRSRPSAPIWASGRTRRRSSRGPPPRRTRRTATRCGRRAWPTRWSGACGGVGGSRSTCWRPRCSGTTAAPCFRPAARLKRDSARPACARRVRAPMRCSHYSSPSRSRRRRLLPNARASRRGGCRGSSPSPTGLDRPGVVPIPGTERGRWYPLQLLGARDPVR